MTAPSRARAALLALALLASACASSSVGKLVQSVEAGAIVHKAAMFEAGKASATCARPRQHGEPCQEFLITPAQLEQARRAGKRLEASLYAAQLVTEIYLVSRAGTGEELRAAGVRLAADLLDLVLKLREMGLEVPHVQP